MYLKHVKRLRYLVSQTPKITLVGQYFLEATNFYTSAIGYVSLYRHLAIVSHWSLIPLKSSRNCHGFFGNTASQSSDDSRLLIGSPGYESCKILIYLYFIANAIFLRLQ